MIHLAGCDRQDEEYMTPLQAIAIVRQRALRIVEMCDAALAAHAISECARYDRERGRTDSEDDPLVILGPGGDYVREIR